MFAEWLKTRREVESREVKCLAQGQTANLGLSQAHPPGSCSTVPTLPPPSHLIPSFLPTHPPGPCSLACTWSSHPHSSSSAGSVTFCSEILDSSNYMLLLKVIKSLCLVEDCSRRSQHLIIALVALIPIIQDYLSRQLGVWVVSCSLSQRASY